MNFSKGLSNIYEQPSNLKSSSDMGLFSNSKNLMKIVISPKNYLKKETNYHTKFSKNYETTLNLIENSNLNNRTKQETSPVYNKIKSVLNEFFEVPLESKINNPKFKIGCICPEVFDLPKQDLKTKMNQTKFEILKKSTSFSPKKFINRSSNSSNYIKEFVNTQQSFNVKEEDDNKDKLRLKTERSTKFASTNCTSTKSETNNPYFSPKNSSFHSTSVFSPASRSNKFFTSSDRKLFKLVNNGKVNESFCLTNKKESSLNQNSVKVNMGMNENYIRQNTFLNGF